MPDYGPLRYASRHALNRVAAAEPKTDESLAALGEALTWLCAVDELLETQDGYKSQRNTDPAGVCLQGLRYARNQMTHGSYLTTTTRIATGLVFPMRYPFSFSDKHSSWAQLRDIPARHVTRSARKLHCAYAAHVQGRPVVALLDGAHGYVDVRLSHLTR